MKKLVVCGDSFSRGIGCLDLENEPFGSLLSKYFNLEHLNLAKGSATHLNIYLQVKYAVQQFKNDINLLLIGTTSYDRIDWFPSGYDHHGDLSLTDVNYHQYPPYKDKSYQVQLDSIVTQDKNYKGKMFTENLVGVIEYWQKWGSKNIKFDYFEKFYNEPPYKMKLLYEYALEIHNYHINRAHSMGLLTMCHNLAKKFNINHLILTPEPSAFNDYVDSINLVNVSWGDLSRKYPDNLPSGHTSFEGHKIIQDLIIEKINRNNWAL